MKVMDNSKIRISIHAERKFKLYVINYDAMYRN